MGKKLRILIGVLLVSLVSCSTSKDCTCSLEREYFISNDTLVIPEWHEHVCDGTDCVCVYVEGSYLPVKDTMWVEIETVK